jgi:hypothetical protein
MAELTQPCNWQEAHQKLLAETTTANLPDLLLAAEEALFQRLQELAGSGDHDEERRRMQAAAGDILRIRTEKLGWAAP